MRSKSKKNNLEANTTKIQMKMFLTRLGRNSQMVVVGDKTQIDLISKNESGLIDASSRLKTLDAPLTEVIMLESIPPVQDSAKDILFFFFFKSLMILRDIFFIKEPYRQQE